MIPKKIYLNYVDEDDEYKTWSEDPVYVEDCEMQNREYTDLPWVWHDSNEIPQHDALILFQSIYGDILLIRFQDRKSSMATIQRWAYVDDLLPKEVRHGSSEGYKESL